jgi:hypothetical protein
MLGVRFPWDIPIEDFGFGFAMVTLTILLWRRLTDRRPADRATSAADSAVSASTSPPAADRPARPGEDRSTDDPPVR